MNELAEELREYTAMKYAGDCKCGKCQLVPRELVERIYHTLNAASQVRAGGEQSEVQTGAVTEKAIHDAIANAFSNGVVTYSAVRQAAKDVLALTSSAAQGAGKPVAWTNEAQLGFLKDPEWAEAPMAMWGKRTDKYADIPLYASLVPSASRGTEA